MDVRWHHVRRTRLVIGLLLVPALALSALVAPGFMPGVGADDAPTMKMCHGSGPLPPATQPSPTGGEPEPAEGRHHEAPCAFAVAGSAAPPPVVALAVHAPYVDDVGAPAPEFVIVPKTLHRAQAARAPPVRHTPA